MLRKITKNCSGTKYGAYIEQANFKSNTAVLTEWYSNQSGKDNIARCTISGRKREEMF